MQDDHRILNDANCLRRTKADRVAFLIDGDAYFSTLYRALVNAERTIFIAGWDIDSRLPLLRANEEQRESSCLVNLLNRIASEKPDLHVYVLAWDFAMIFAAEREFIPSFKLGWLTHERVHFHMDDQHPLGGSHHQKIVVVDEELAFTGGLDLTSHRWDTAEHRLADPRRTDPDGTSYHPFHDVQAAVQGETASCLAEIFRDRWRRATGSLIPAGGSRTTDPWPENLDSDLRNVTVGVARTIPAFKGHPEVREVERLFLDAVASARTTIYIENQYLTSHTFGKALQERLREEDGPEVVIVLPRRSSGWLEEQTMDALRHRLIGGLMESDPNGRLGLFFPLIREGEDVPVYVHAKVLIVDNRLVVIGSSNLSNRSMGLDTECDLGIEAGNAPHAQASIASFRNRLLAHHLGESPEDFSRSMEEQGSLIKTILGSRNPGRSLEPFSREELNEESILGVDVSLADPEQPVDPDQLFDELVPEEMQTLGVSRVTRVTLMILIMGFLAAAWRWTPLGEILSVSNLVSWANDVRDHPASPLIVLGAYGLGGLIVFPVMVLVGATALVFPPLTATMYSLAGSLLSAVILYGIGHLLGRRGVGRIAGQKLPRISSILAKRGILAIFMVRILPVAPYSIINVVAGALHVKFLDYCIGTALGLTPGIVLISFFARQVRSFMDDPQLTSWLVVLALVMIGVGLTVGVQRFVKKRLEKRESK